MCHMSCVTKTLYIYFILFSDKLVELVAGLGHVQAGVAAGTVDEEQDGGGDAVLLDVVAQVVDDVEEGV